MPNFERQVFEEVISDPEAEAKQAAWSAERSASKVEAKSVEALPSTDAINRVELNAAVLDSGEVERLKDQAEVERIRAQLAEDEAHTNAFLAKQSQRYTSGNTAQLNASVDLRRKHAGQQQVGLG